MISGAGVDDNEARTASDRRDPWPSRLRFVGVGLLAAAILRPISGILTAFAFGDFGGDSEIDGGFVQEILPSLRERISVAAQYTGYVTGLILLVSVLVLVLDDITAGEPSRSQTPLTKVALRVALVLGVVVVAANLYLGVESVIGQRPLGVGSGSARASSVVATLSGAVIGAAAALLARSALHDDVATKRSEDVGDPAG